MKKTIFTLVALVIAAVSFAQNQKYVAAMKKNIILMDSAFGKPDLFLGLANTFERIGTAEKSEWLPYYYASLCRINVGFMQKDMSLNDPLADASEVLLNKADSLMPNNSEISCAKSMIATLRMLVNAQQRFMQYGAVSEKALQAAMKQDTTNPRPYMLKGQTLKGTPEQFGGGCKVAKTFLQTAVDKFATFKPATELLPNWGEKYTMGLLKECE